MNDSFSDTGQDYRTKFDLALITARMVLTKNYDADYANQKISVFVERISNLKPNKKLRLIKSIARYGRSKGA